MIAPSHPLGNFLAHRGSYTLVIGLRRKRWIQVGRLGRACFPRGTYLYTGRAMIGLRTRLGRHLRRKNKKTRWHIDYLLKCPEAHVKKVVVYPGASRKECRLNQRMATLPGAKVILKGFGASDCCSGCPSHLFYFFKTPRVDVLPFRPYPLPLPIKEKK